MQGFDNHRKPILWELTCWTVQINKISRIYCLTQVELLTGGGDMWEIESQNQGRKVAEDGTQIKRESSSSFCLPKVYPVVYTPRRAAAPRAEGATLWSKMNMWHIWLFSKRVFSRRITHVPIFLGCTGSGKGYGLLLYSPPTHAHTPALPPSYCESMSP